LSLLLYCLPWRLRTSSSTAGTFKTWGWDNNKDYEKVSHIAQHFDAMAIQELINEGALEHIEKASGEIWASMASHALGRST
jgi:hypothetical protein